MPRKLVFRSLGIVRNILRVRIRMGSAFPSMRFPTIVCKNGLKP